MLHTLAPLAGGSPHNGLQIIHSFGSAKAIACCNLSHSFFATVFLPTPQALLPKNY
jgi:hypothetical protein